jgi:hypothetical protein
MEHPDALLAFRRAAARWERVINDKITIVIDVDYGPKDPNGSNWGPNVIGSTDAALYIIINNQNKIAGSADVVSFLKMKHTGNSQLQNLYNAIPVPTKFTTGSKLDTAIAGLVELQALGLEAADMDPDPLINPYGTVPNISFNSKFTFDLDPSDGITSGMIDFDAVVVHEMGHALGFFSAVGGFSGKYFFTPMDLFRVRPETVTEGSLTGFNTADRVITPGPPFSQILTTVRGRIYYKANQVFFDGLKIRELSTGDGSAQGGDGSQASHWRDDVLRLPSLDSERTIGIMDPTISPGVRDTMRINDLRAFEVLGYDVNYSPIFASVMVKFDSKTLDPDNSADTIRPANVDINSVVNIPVQLINTNLDNPLEYRIEVIPAFKIPSSASGSLTINSPEGTITAGQSADINLTLNGGSAPSVYFGVLEFHTNDLYKPVVIIPYEFTSGNASAPSISFSIPVISDFRFEKNTSTSSLSRDITIYNKGSIDLDYKLITSLSSNNPNPPPLSKSAGNHTAGNNIYRFFKPGSITDSLIFSADFENGLGSFTASGAGAADWHTTTRGKAGGDGHSKPSAAYFGFDYGDSLRTRSNTDAMIVSPALDLSVIPVNDLITISFNYYLDAELGSDFAHVLVSTDGGLTYNTAATSQGGILHNTASWEPVLIQLPNVSGNTDPVRIAFKFTSDTYINKEGWYIDDIQVNSIRDGNPVFTSLHSGVVPGSGSSSFSLTINRNNLLPGYYQGNLTIQNNDPVHGDKNFLFNIANLQVNTADSNKLYAVSYRSGGKLLLINQVSGNASELGAAGMEGVKSLTINPLTLQIFALNVQSEKNNIIIMDAVKGTGVFYITPDVNLDAISFDGTGTLYGAGSDQNLYKVNLETGKTEPIKQLGFNAAAMTFNPFSGDLWFSVDASSDKDRLYKLNLSGGDIILIGKTGQEKITRGLAFDKDNNLFGVTGDILQASNFISINTENASGTQVGPVGQSAVYGLAMKIDTTSSLKPPEDVPSEFKLGQNYPNPFNPETTINYSIPENSHVTIKVFNILAQEIETIVDEDKTSGNYQVKFYGGNLSTGIYLYEMKAGNFISVRKMILTK